MVRAPDSVRRDAMNDFLYIGFAALMLAAVLGLARLCDALRPK
jgi:hypothetical protein